MPILNKSNTLHSQLPYASGQLEEKGEPATGLGKSKSKSESESPHVLLSTSFLARGLDFDPSVSHLFVLYPPRNTADFLHCAGRTARAGCRGRVWERCWPWSEETTEMRHRLAALRGISTFPTYCLPTIMQLYFRHHHADVSKKARRL